MLPSGKYGCCPLAQGDLDQSKMLSFAVKQSNVIDVTRIICPGGQYSCPNYNTCCSQAFGYGCCPFYDGVCCAGMQHCCSRGSYCTSTGCRPNNSSSIYFDRTIIILLSFYLISLLF